VKVLLVRLDALGDNLLSTPAIARLDRALQPLEANISVVTHHAWTPVYRGLGQVDAIGASPEQSRSGSSLKTLFAAQQPDCLFLLTEKRKSSVAAYQCNIPARIGFDPGWSQPLKSLSNRVLLTHRLPYSNRLEEPSKINEVERYAQLIDLYLAVLEKAGSIDSSWRSQPLDPLWLEINQSELENAQTQLDSLKLKQPVALQITPKWSLHGWSAEHLKQLFSQLPEDRILLYGPGEQDWVSAHWGESIATQGLCFTDLHQYGGCLKECSALITPDTGAAHVAAAVGTPVVDVFPAVHSDHCVPRWRPWQVASEVVLSELGRPDQLSTSILQALSRIQATTKKGPGL
jgi:ADP-heptose:LPS heptosyltransferase